MLFSQMARNDCVAFLFPHVLCFAALLEPLGFFLKAFQVFLLVLREGSAFGPSEADLPDDLLERHRLDTVRVDEDVKRCDVGQAKAQPFT